MATPSKRIRFDEDIITPTRPLEKDVVVWAKIVKKWKPGLILKVHDSDLENCQLKYTIFWFGNRNVSEVPADMAVSFKDNYRTVMGINKQWGKMWLEGVTEALNELANTYTYTSFNDLQEWVNTTLPCITGKLTEIPEWIIKAASRSISYKEAKEKPLNSSNNVTSQKIEIKDLFPVDKIDPHCSNLVCSTVQWENGSIVWAYSEKLLWPAMVIKLEKHTGISLQKFILFWFAKRNTLQVSANSIYPFKENYKSVFIQDKKYDKLWLQAVKEALQELANNNKMSFSQLKQWAMNGFVGSEARPNRISRWIEIILKHQHFTNDVINNIVVSEQSELLEINVKELNINNKNINSCPIESDDPIVLKMMQPVVPLTRECQCDQYLKKEEVPSFEEALCKNNLSALAELWPSIEIVVIVDVDNDTADDDIEYTQCESSTEDQESDNELVKETSQPTSSINFMKTVGLEGIIKTKQMEFINLESETNQNEMTPQEEVKRVLRSRKQSNTNLIHSTQQLNSGNIVWAEFCRKWWPAIIIEPLERATNTGAEEYNLFWFGDKQTSKVSTKAIMPFKDNYKYIFNDSKNFGNLWFKAVEEALQELACSDKMTICELHEWAKNDFIGSENRINEIPEWIKNKLCHATSIKNDTLIKDKQLIVPQKLQNVKRKLNKSYLQSSQNEPGEDDSNNDYDSSTDYEATVSVSLIKKRQRSSSFVYSNQRWELGSIVWAEFLRQWWSAIIIETPDFNNETNLSEKYKVFWFGDKRISQVTAKRILPFKENYSYLFNIGTRYGNVWLKGVKEALTELANTDEKMSFFELRQWAENNFPNSEQRSNKIPDWIKTILKRSVHLNNSFNYEQGKLKSSEQQPKLEIIRKAELSDKQKEIIKASSEKGKHLNGVCLACYKTDVIEEHPYFYGHICFGCLSDIKTAIKCMQQNEGTKFCVICTDSNPTIFCSNSYCSFKSYCDRCLENLAAPNLKKKREKLEDRWLCFWCIKKPIKTMNGVLFPRGDYQVKVEQLFNKDNPPLIERPILSSKNKLRVLSLFDTLGAGLLALNSLKIPVEVYYCVETDPNIINTSDALKQQFKDLGTFEDFCLEKVYDLGPIDLILIGSPSVDTAVTQPNINGIYGPMSRGINIFEFYRIVTILTQNYSQKFFWFFETPVSTVMEYKIIITRYLQCDPVTLDIPLMTLQQCSRMFWGNIPTLSSNLQEAVEKYSSTVSKENLQNQPEEQLGFTENHVKNLTVGKKEEALRISWSVHFMKSLLGFLCDIL